ncbi:LysR family transcriptional regulator [Campylobacterota bacterium]|nr:LysR family transcriptional regulator [Campylobacterota bacterium]
MVFGDFAKIRTLLTVINESSLSRASKKLGISQPAVTQQIKALEAALGRKIIDRKKNGVVATAEGNEFLKIAIRLTDMIEQCESEANQLLGRNEPLILAASHIATNYLLPLALGNMETISEIIIKTEHNENLPRMLKTREADLAVFESDRTDSEISAKAWLSDEIVICSNYELPPTIPPADFANYEWIGRFSNSHTRQLVTEKLRQMGFGVDALKRKAVYPDPTAVKQAALKASRQLCCVLSHSVVADELASGKLFAARIEGAEVWRTFYIGSLASRANELAIANTMEALLRSQRTSE